MPSLDENFKVKNGLTVNETISAGSCIEADSFEKHGGTSSQFLKADGSVDSSSYTTCCGDVTGIDAGTAIVIGDGNTSTPSVGVTTACNTTWNSAYTTTKTLSGCAGLNKTGTVISVTRGNGIDGSGDITTTGSIAVGQGTGIAVGANVVSLAAACRNALASAYTTTANLSSCPGLDKIGDITAVTTGPYLTGGASCGSAEIGIDSACASKWDTSAAGDISAVTTSSLLSGGGTSGSVEVGIDSGALQYLNQSACPGICKTGTMTCVSVSDGLETTGGNSPTLGIATACNTKWDQSGCPGINKVGDITAVVAGPGLQGGGTSGSATLQVDYVGADNFILEAQDLSGSTVASTDNIVFSDGSADVSFATVADLPFTNNAGDITGVTAGAGLSGGGSSGSVSVAVDGALVTTLNQSACPGICCQGTTTPSNTQTFTNKSGNISQWTNDSGYLTSACTGTVTNVAGCDGITVNNGTGSACVCVDNTVVRTSGAQIIADTKNFSGSICVGNNITHTGDSNTKITFATDTMALCTGGEGHICLTNSGVTINESGLANDFRVESDNNTHALFVDGSADKVGIGCNAPGCTLTVAGDSLISGNTTIQGNLSVTGDFTYLDTFVDVTSAMSIVNNGTGPALLVNQTGANDVINFQDDGTSALYIENGGNVGIGCTNPAAKLDVDGGINTCNAYYVDTGIVINCGKCFVGTQVRPTTDIADAYIASAACWNACATSTQGTKADNALPKAGGAMTGAITTTSTFDGRNVANDGSKLDGIACGAQPGTITGIGVSDGLETTGSNSPTLGIATACNTKWDQSGCSGITCTGTMTCVSVSDGLETTGGNSPTLGIATACNTKWDQSGCPGINKVGDITAVVAGSQLTGGATSGSATVNVSLSASGPGAGTYGNNSSGCKINTITLDEFGKVTAVGCGTTGDITAVCAGTNLTGGGGGGAVTLNMATGGAGAATYGCTSNNKKIDTITLDAYGRVTAVAVGSTCVGDITGVTAGAGLSGGGTSGTVIVAVDGALVTTLNQSACPGICCQGTMTCVSVSDGLETTGGNSPTLGIATACNTKWNQSGCSGINCTGTTTPSNTQTFTNKSGNISQWTNNSNYSTCLGDICGVTAGAGLSGGASSGIATVAVDGALVTALNQSACPGICKTGTMTCVSVSDGLETTGGNSPTLGIATACNTKWDQSGCPGICKTGTVTSIATGTGLDGGITTSGTITLDLAELADMTQTMVSTDEFIVLDASTQKRKAACEISNAVFSNGAGYTTCTGTGDITSVGAGAGLTGGATSGAATLNVGAGTAITVAADTVGVNSTCNSTWNAKTTCTGTTTPSNTQTFTNKSGSNNQWTNDRGYTCNTGTTTASNTQTFTNKSGNISQWNNNSGYTTCTGDITSVTAGTGLGGGGSSGGVSLCVDSTVARTNVDETFNCDLTINGDLTVTGDFVCFETIVSTTSALSVTNHGTGPGLFVCQAGSNAVVNFVDAEVGSIFYVENGGNVGIRDTNPAHALDVNGCINVTGEYKIDDVDVINTGKCFVGTQVRPTTDIADAYIASAGCWNAKTTCTGTTTPSNTQTFTNKSGSNNQWTNDAGYTTCTGTTTPSNTQTFTNKSGNISQWTNNSGYTTCTGTGVGNITCVTTSTGLDGAGSSGTVNISLDLAELADGTATVVPTSDEVIYLDAGTQKRKLFSEIFGCNAYNSTAFTTCIGDITGVTAGAGLCGGGSSGTPTLNVGAGTAITVAADTVGVTTACNTAWNAKTTCTGTTTPTSTETFTNKSGCISQWNNNSGYTTCTGDITGVTAGTLLDGGGASGSVTLSVDLSELTDMTEAWATGSDEFVVLDSGSQKRKLSCEIFGCNAFSSTGFTTCTGDITSVTAGSGLTGGSSSGGATLNVGAGTAITVAADTVGVNSTCNSTWNAKTTCTGTTTPSNTQTFTNKSGCISQWNNNSGYTTCIGDVTGVTAGTGMTGGGSSGTPTLNVIGGSGITANANDIAVDSTVLRTSGNQTASGIKCFSSGIKTDTVTNCTGTQLVLNGGEASSVATGQTGEAVYINAESGLIIASSPDNWASGWACRKESYINNTSGNSNFSNNITLGGTVDGRNVANDGSKLDGIACGATSCTGDVTGVTAGSGLTGGGSSGTPTLNVGAGTAITVAANTVGVNSTCNSTWNAKTTCTGTTTPSNTQTFTCKSGNISMWTNNSGYTTSGMVGTLIGACGFTTCTGTTTTSNTQSFTNKSGCISQWNNNSGYTTCIGDVTGVTAGTGMTGGGTSGTPTLNVIGGTGITANANDIAVDSTVIRTTGTQTIGGVKTFSSDLKTSSSKLCVNGQTASYIPGGCFTGSMYFGNGGTSGSYTSSNNGRFNTGVGNGSLFKNTTGCGNTAVGYDSLECNTTGYYNVAVGNKSLCTNTIGWLNTAIGYEALKVNVDGNYNVAIGAYVLDSNIGGDGNTGVGYKTLCDNTTGSYGTSYGYQSMRFNTTGYGNTAMGYQAAFYTTTGFDNTAMGKQALFCSSTGCFNTAVGKSALYCNSANSNTGIGYNALYHARGTNANNSTGIGYAAGRFIANGSTHNTAPYQAVFIGSNTKSKLATGTNEIVIGYNAIGCGSNTAKIGNTSTTVVCSNGSFSTVSDIRDKTCICDLEYGLSFIGELKPKTYNMVTDRDDKEGSISCKRHGFIAQDVIALEGTDNVIINNDNIDRLGINSDFIVPILVKGMQEQQEIINELKANQERLEQLISSK